MTTGPEATITLRPIVVPADLGGPDSADFSVMVDLRNRINRVVRGEQAVAATPAQTLPAFQDQADEAIHAYLVLADGEPIGRGMLYVPAQEGSRGADVRIEILPEWWGRGAGRHTFDHLVALARDQRRTVLHGWTDHQERSARRLTARTGWGSVPEDHIAAAMTAFGFSLEQVYRASALDLTQPLERIDEILAAAQRAASGYRYVSWSLPTPPEWREGYAWMKSRMSTDSPAGDMDFDEQIWDADRVARMDDRLVAQGYTGVIGAAQHIGTGELVAYTELYMIGEDHSRPTSQNDTLVLKEHRGHRLGALVKAETLKIWRERMPTSPKVLTNNAEENRPMLSINEAMGFVPIAYAGMWQMSL